MPYVGQKVTDEGSFIAFNALRFYQDPEHHFPYRIPLTFLEMFQSVNYEIPADFQGVGSYESHGVGVGLDATDEIEPEKLTLPECLIHLEENEDFQWIIYAEFNHPDGDKLLDFKLIIPDDLAGFLTCKINREISEKHPLKSGESFKILFTFTRNDAWETFLKKKKAQVNFGFEGRGRRTGIT